MSKDSQASRYSTRFHENLDQLHGNAEVGVKVRESSPRCAPRTKQQIATAIAKRLPKLAHWVTTIIPRYRVFDARVFALTFLNFQNQIYERHSDEYRVPRCLSGTGIL